MLKGRHRVAFVYILRCGFINSSDLYLTIYGNLLMNFKEPKCKTQVSWPMHYIPASRSLTDDLLGSSSLVFNSINLNYARTRNCSLSWSLIWNEISLNVSTIALLIQLWWVDYRESIVGLNKLLFQHYSIIETFNCYSSSRLSESMILHKVEYQM